MTGKAVEIMLRELKGMASETDDQIKILENCIARRWAWIYPLKEPKGGRNSKKPAEKPKNRFNNFDQRDHDYETMVWDDMKKRKGNGGVTADGGNETGSGGKQRFDT